MLWKHGVPCMGCFGSAFSLLGRTFVFGLRTKNLKTFKKHLKPRKKVFKNLLINLGFFFVQKNL